MKSANFICTELKIWYHNFKISLSDYITHFDSDFFRVRTQIINSAKAKLYFV